ncbi:MAG: hypothetical protein ABIO68_04980 [Sphingomicrobium sp.]
MSYLWDTCGSFAAVKISPAISAVQMDAITWPRETSRRWVGEQRDKAMSDGNPGADPVNDPDLARTVNDLLARFANF